MQARGKLKNEDYGLGVKCRMKTTDCRLQTRGKMREKTAGNMSALVKVKSIKIYLRANVAKNQTFSKYCGNSSKINSAHILMLGRP